MQTPLPPATAGPLSVYQAQDGSMWAVNPSSGFGLQIAPPGGTVALPPGGGGISEAPTDGQLYARQSAAWTPVPPQGESLYAEEWRWTISTTPGNGQVTLDGSPDWASAVNLDLSIMSNDGRDMTVTFNELFSVGNDVYVQVTGSSANAATYTIAGAGINNSTWWQFPLTFKSSSGTLPQNNAAVDVTVFVKGAGGGGGNAVQKSGDTMTGTLTINTSDGSKKFIIDDTSFGVGYDVFAILASQNLTFRWYSAPDLVLSRYSPSGMHNLVSLDLDGGAFMLRGTAGSAFLLYGDTTTGSDVIIECIAGPNSGKSVNLTAGKWA